MWDKICLHDMVTVVTVIRGKVYSGEVVANNDNWLALRGDSNEPVFIPKAAIESFIIHME